MRQNIVDQRNRARAPGVQLADLNTEWFEDADLAESLSGDCLKLFEASEEDFASVRNQPWYKRIWSTISGGNTRKLARGATSLAQAQQLLLQVLQVHAKSSARSNALMTSVARGLRHLEMQQNKVVDTILSMADRLEILENEVSLHRRQLDADPCDVDAWNQEHRLVLWKVMVLAAYADGGLDDGERSVLMGKREELALTGEYRSEAEEFFANPSSIDEELERIDSYKMRVTIFRHAVGVMYADGTLHPSELVRAERLRTLLHIKESDEKRVRELFAKASGQITAEKIRSLLSASSKSRGMRAPDREEYRAVDQRKEALRAEEAQREKNRQVWRDIFDSVSSDWRESVAKVLAYSLVEPVHNAYEAYGAVPDDAELEDTIAPLDATRLVEAVNRGIPESRVAFGNVLGTLERGGFHLSEATWKACEDAFENAVDDDLGWTAALEQMAGSGVALIEAKPSVLGTMAAGGALGYAGAALLGPIGWIGAAAAMAMAGNSVDEDFQAAARRWERSVQLFGEATDRWKARATEHLDAVLADVVAEGFEFIDASAADDQVGELIDAMQELLDEVGFVGE